MPAKTGRSRMAHLLTTTATRPMSGLTRVRACRTFDNKLGRRRFGEYAENYSHDGDSGGIHASGAGFEKMDPAEAWRPPVY
jgi:hypothetical protein